MTATIEPRTTRNPRALRIAVVGLLLCSSGLLLGASAPDVAGAEQARARLIQETARLRTELLRLGQELTAQKATHLNERQLLQLTIKMQEQRLTDIQGVVERVTNLTTVVMVVAGVLTVLSMGLVALNLRRPPKAAVAQVPDESLQRMAREHQEQLAAMRSEHVRTLDALSAEAAAVRNAGSANQVSASQPSLNQPSADQPAPKRPPNIDFSPIGNASEAWQVLTGGRPKNMDAKSGSTPVKAAELLGDTTVERVSLAALSMFPSPVARANRADAVAGAVAAAAPAVSVPAVALPEAPLASIPTAPETQLSSIALDDVLDEDVGGRVQRPGTAAKAGPALATRDHDSDDADVFELNLDATIPPYAVSKQRASSTHARLSDSLDGQKFAYESHDTMDPSRLAAAGSAKGASEADAELLKKLAALELGDDLRGELNSSPELLRALVQQALGVLHQPEAQRTAKDWRLLVIDAWRRSNFEEALARTDAMAKVASTTDERIEAHMQRALVLEKLGHERQALDAFSNVAMDGSSAADPQSSLRQLQALLHQGTLQRRELRDVGAARTTLEDLVRRVGTRRDVAHARLLVRGLVNLALAEAGPGGNVEQALMYYDRAQQEFAGNPDHQIEVSVAQALFNRTALLFEHNNDLAAALLGYEQLSQRYAGNKEPGIVLVVANTLRNVATLLVRHRRDVPAALNVYRDLDQRFSEHRDRDVAVLVAHSLYAAASLAAQEPATKAAAAELFGELVRRYELFPDAEFSLLVAKSMFNIGLIRGAGSATEDEALATYDALVERFGKRQEPAFGEWVAGALINKASLLIRRRADHVQAFETYWQVVRSFGASTDVGTAEQVAKALLNIGTLASQQGDVDGAMAAYQELGRRYATTIDTRLAQVMARGMANLASLYANQRNDVDAALQTFSDIANRFDARTEPSLVEHAARSLLSMGMLLGGARKDLDGAIATYDVLLHRYADRTEPAVELIVVKGLFNQAALQAREQRNLYAGLRTLDNLLARYGQSEQPGAVERIASAMVNRAHILDLTGNHDGARQAFNDVMQRFGASQDEHLRRQVAAAQNALLAPPHAAAARDTAMFASRAG